MPRRARHAPPGLIYHVLNRGVGRQTLCHKAEDDPALGRLAFESCPVFWSAYDLYQLYWVSRRGLVYGMGELMATYATRQCHTALSVVVSMLAASVMIVTCITRPTALAQPDPRAQPEVGRSLLVNDDYSDRAIPTIELVRALNSREGDDRMALVTRIESIARKEEGYSRYVALRVLAGEFNGRRLKDERGIFATLVDLALCMEPSTLRADGQRLSDLDTQAFPLRWTTRIDGTDQSIGVMNVTLHLTASLDGTVACDQDIGNAIVEFAYPVKDLKEPVFGDHDWEVKVTATSPRGTVYRRNVHYTFRLVDRPPRFSEIPRASPGS